MCVDSVNDVILLPPLPADSADDFESVDIILPFGANTPKLCVPISIKNDDVVEQIESFYVTLERTPGLDDSVLLGPTQQVVTIVNDDGEAKLMSHSLWYGQLCM